MDVSTARKLAGIYAACSCNQLHHYTIKDLSTGRTPIRWLARRLHLLLCCSASACNKQPPAIQPGRLVVPFICKQNC